LTCYIGNKVMWDVWWGYRKYTLEVSREGSLIGRNSRGRETSISVISTSSKMRSCCDWQSR